MRLIPLEANSSDGNEEVVVNEVRLTCNECELQNYEDSCLIIIASSQAFPGEELNVLKNKPCYVLSFRKVVSTILVKKKKKAPILFLLPLT